MKNKFLLAFLCIGLLTLNFSCQKEDSIIEETSINPGIETLDASKALDEIHNRSAVQRNNNSIFNKIDLDKKAKRIIYESGNSTYTFSLLNNNTSSRSSDFVYTVDNLNIAFDEEGDYIINIIRYIPEMSWFNNSDSKLDSYTGEIKLLNENEEILGEVYLTDGSSLEDTSANRTSNRTTTECTGHVNEILVCQDNPFVEDCDYEYTTNLDCRIVDEPEETTIDDGGSSGGGGGGGSVDTIPILDTCRETGTCNDNPCENIGEEGCTTIEDIERSTLIQNLGNRLNQEQIDWINTTSDIESLQSLNNFLNQSSIFNRERFGNFAIDAIIALIEDRNVNFDDLYIETDVADDNFMFQGNTDLISSPLTLDNGSMIEIMFGTTKSDNENANKEVSVDLINGIKFAIQQANENLPNEDKITSIYISATTNGRHSPTSNHSRGTAVDISRINGQKMILSGVTNQIIELQKAFDNFTFIRENFGPHFKHKTLTNGDRNLNHPVGGHRDHIHISIRRP